MSPVTEVALVTGRELRKSFRSTKGVLLAVLSIAGGAGFAMLFAWLDRVKRENLPPGTDWRAAQEEFFSRWYVPETGKMLATCPYSLWMMLIATLWLAPWLVALMAFDAVSGEMQHRTVCFWTIRVRRAPYMIGKCLGAWTAVLAVMLGMNVVVWAATAAVGQWPAADVVRWGARFFAVTLPISAAWCGIATLVGSQFKTPFLSLLFISATFFCLWVLRVSAGFAQAHWLAYAYPNTFDGLLLSPNLADTARGLLFTGLIALATASAAALVFQRKDV
jgi:ABC-type transport system involved in multi-copper enzyme maturation permease subunit